MVRPDQEFLAVTAVVGIGIAIAKSVAADKAQTKALRAQNVRRINPACASSGHAYKIFDTGWRCATCGNYVSQGRVAGGIFTLRLPRIPA